MISRRNLFGFLGMGSASVAVPLVTNRLLDPGRRVTHLPDGGALIEDETFTTGIAVNGSQYLTLQNCIINAGKSALEVDV
jgi:hypothetical protein